MTQQHELLLKAYSLLEDTTPKKYDCGRLCSSACCHANSSHGDDICGMLLLPGEKELLEGCSDFNISSTPEGMLLVCNGNCIREIRPFACRIFPFYPKIHQHGQKYSIKLAPDPRSFGICPVFSDFRARKASLSFLRNAKKAVRLLLKEEQIAKELLSQSELLEDIEKLRAALIK